MSVLNLSPTRVNLKTLKNRLVTAKRGHKMLKDKTDSLIRIFSNLIKKNYKLRLEVDNSFLELKRDYSLFSSFSSFDKLQGYFLLNVSPLVIDFENKSYAGVKTPQIKSYLKENILPYSYIDSNSLLDSLVSKTQNLMPKILELASLEKTCEILGKQIEENKRRVNALENVLIPNYIDTIKYISLKLEENERASRIRLIKFKDFMK